MVQETQLLLYILNGDPELPPASAFQSRISQVKTTYPNQTVVGTNRNKRDIKADSNAANFSVSIAVISSAQVVKFFSVVFVEY